MDPTVIGATINPTTDPTKIPSINPTESSISPTTAEPTLNPSNTPSKYPTINPTLNPSFNPTLNPSKSPSIDPTNNPSLNPSKQPSVSPTLPTNSPSNAPSVSPTNSPSNPPTNNPTESPTKSPTNAPTWSPTADLLVFDRTLIGNNKPLKCGSIYNQNITKNNEYNYYKLDISDIESIPKMLATTCCKSVPDAKIIDGVEYWLNEDDYCKNSSLDTVIYLLKYEIKKNQVSIVTTDDDTKSAFCGDGGSKFGKSTIDISTFSTVFEINNDDIEYFIAVGGYTEDFKDDGYIIDTGKYQIELVCEDYIYPLDEGQFLIHVNNASSEDIECGETLKNQENTDNDLVSYYYFDITDSTEKPIIISTCNNNYDLYGNYATYIYISSIQYYRSTASGYTILKHETLDKDNCDDDENNGIDISLFENGEYLIAVAGFNDDIYNNFGNLEIGNFPISVSCGIPPEPLDTAFLAGLGIAISIIIIIVLCLFCCFYCKKLSEAKRQRDEENEKYDNNLTPKEIQDLALSNGDEIEEIIKNSLQHETNSTPGALTDNKSYGEIIEKRKSFRSIGGIPVEIQDEKPNHLRVQSKRNDDIELTTRISMGGTEHKPDLDENGHIKGLRLDDEDIEQHPEMDMVIAVMRDVIASCSDEEGLDIYQVWAFRSLDNKSKRLKLFTPFKSIGIKYELVSFSPYDRARFVAFIVACLQVIGMSIILYSVTYEYFTDPSSSSACSWQSDDWTNSWMFKMLAFMWSLVITFSLSITFRSLKHTAFNQVIDRIQKEKYQLLDVDVGIIFIGYLINLYTLLLAVFGSYFLIYSSEQGAGAIDMVLNAVALFFMIELDDILVTNNDYEDIKEKTDQFIKRYFLSQNDMNEIMENGKQWFGTKGLTRLSKAVKCFSFAIQSITVLGGLFAPLAILICFG